MATPTEHLQDAVVNYLASLGDHDFKALVAQARPPVDETPDETPATALSAIEAVRRRHGRVQGEEVTR